MDYDALRAGLQGAIPFNTHLTLEVVEVGQARGVVRLPDDPRLRNHVGSQHAAALFAAGEAASGAAFVGAFVERMPEITPLAESAEIDYRRIARGPIVATAELSADLQELHEALERDGVVRFPVDVDLADREGSTVASMTVRWHVKRAA